MTEPLSSKVAADALREVGAQLLVRGWLSANSVVFAGGDDQPGIVVDTGYSSHAAQTVNLLRRSLPDGHVSAIINTHLHSDHCGGNAPLKREWPSARISVPSGYRQALCPWDESSLSYRHTGQTCERFVPDEFLDPGADLWLGNSRWQVHAAPGHDPDALIFFEPTEGILISGDALWEERLAIIFPALSIDSGFDDAHRALDLIERLRPRVVLPGHGEAFTDVASAISQSRARLNSFQRAPERHRRYAARALVMYHMLEVRQCPRTDLSTWMVATPIFREALSCADDDSMALALAAETIDRMLSDGVLVGRGALMAIPNAV